MVDDGRRELEFIASLAIFSESKNIVEVGVCDGRAANFFCNAAQRNNGKYVGFDCWKEHGLWNQFKMQYSKNGVSDMLTTNGYNRFELIQIDTIEERIRFGEELDRVFPDGIDFAFIDACHSYLGIASDFSTIYPRMAKTGIVVFHDTLRIDGCREFIVDLRSKYYDGTYDIIDLPWGYGERRCGVSVLSKKSYPILGIGIDEVCGSLSTIEEIEKKELDHMLLQIPKTTEKIQLDGMKEKILNIELD